MELKNLLLAAGRLFVPLLLIFTVNSCKNPGGDDMPFWLFFVGGGSASNDPGLTITPESIAPISENGGSASYKVALNTEPDGNVVLNVASSDTTEATISLAQLTFTPSNWSTAQTVNITAVDDGIEDGNRTVKISHSINGASTSDTTGYADLGATNVSVTVMDYFPGITINDGSVSAFSENGGTTSFTVVLNTQPTGDVVLNVASSDTTEATVSTATLTFTTSNWSTPQTVTVTGQDDDMADGNQTFDITVDVNAGSTVDTVYKDAGQVTQSYTVSVTSQDDDTSGITTTPVSTLTTISESGTTSTTFDVVLNSQPDGNVVINIVSGDTTEADVDLSQIIFTTANWSTPKTVTVTSVNDDVDDGNQTFNVTLSVDGTTADTTGYALLPAKNLSQTVSDDDTAGITTTPVSTLANISENGGTTTFDVVLNTQPGAGENVIITVTSGDTTEAKVDTIGSPAASVDLTFTDADWSTPQTVNVTGQNDDMADGNQSMNITLAVSASSSDTTGYKSLSSKNLALTVTDDDTAGFTVDSSSVAPFTEAGSTTFTVKLNTQPSTGDNVIVTVASSDTTEALVASSGAPASSVDLTFTDADWSTPQTITVSGLDDEIIDGNQTFDISLTVSGSSTDSTGYQILTISPVSVTVQDDEPSCSSIGAGSASIDVSWTQSRSYDVATVAGGGHKIYVSTSSGVTKLTTDVIDVPNTTSLTSGTISGVTRGCTYYIRVGAYSALNTAGGDLSTESSITVPVP